VKVMLVPAVTHWLCLLPSRPFAHAANTRKKYRKFMILFLNLFF
jgi:hypothetical protein